MGVESFPSKPAMISLLVLVATASCAPQYGAPPPLPSPTPTPEKLIAPVTPAIACTVTYVTVWDTEYHDNEKEVCVTEYEKVCSTELQRLCQPTTRQECTTSYEQQCSTVYKNVCVQKYKQFMSLTQKPNARRSTSRIASTSGRGRATTRFGLPLTAPARVFPMTSARMCRRPTQGKLPTRLATRSQRRAVSPSQRKFAFPSPTRFARTSLSPNVRRFPVKLAIRSIDVFRSG